MSLRYTCPGCETPLGYNGLSRKCKCEQERKNLWSMKELKTAKELGVHVKASSYMYPPTRYDKSAGSGRLTAEQAAEASVRTIP